MWKETGQSLGLTKFKVILSCSVRTNANSMRPCLKEAKIKEKRDVKRWGQGGKEEEEQLKNRTCTGALGLSSSKTG